MYEACNAVLGSPEASAEIAEDEEKLFDRSRNRFFFVRTPAWRNALSTLWLQLLGV